MSTLHWVLIVIARVVGVGVPRKVYTRLCPLDVLGSYAARPRGLSLALETPRQTSLRQTPLVRSLDFWGLCMDGNTPPPV